ncbi:hypothetical protein BDV10DRAFT_165875 [Aspergillus recurvatus]
MPLINGITCQLRRTPCQVQNVVFMSVYSSTRCAFATTSLLLVVAIPYILIGNCTGS